MAAVAFGILLVVASASASILSLPRAFPVGDPELCPSNGQLCFSYDENSPIGPPSWFKVCQTRSCFFGENQSPIHIDPANVQSACGDRIGYSGDPKVEGIVINEGIYPAFNPESNTPPLSGVPGFTTAVYRFRSLHIHFRGFNSEGQEHKIGTSDYDAEMHLVHTRDGVVNPLLEEAGIAVIGVHLSTKQGQASEELDKLLNTMKNVQEYRLNLCREFFMRCHRRIYSAHYFKKCHGDDNGGSSDSDSSSHEDTHDFCRRFFSKPIRGKKGNGHADLKSDPGQCPEDPEPECLDNDCGEIPLTLRLDGLLPERRDFAYYYGSLTAPPVSEAVLWNVMTEPVRISEHQLMGLQQLESREKGVKIAVNGNVRPRQPLNGRTVYENFCP